MPPPVYEPEHWDESLWGEEDHPPPTIPQLGAIGPGVKGYQKLDFGDDLCQGECTCCILQPILTSTEANHFTRKVSLTENLWKAPVDCPHLTGATAACTGCSAGVLKPIDCECYPLVPQPSGIVADPGCPQAWRAAKMFYKEWPSRRLVKSVISCIQWANLPEFAEYAQFHADLEKEEYTPFSPSLPWYEAAAFVRYFTSPGKRVLLPEIPGKRSQDLKHPVLSRCPVWVVENGWAQLWWTELEDTIYQAYLPSGWTGACSLEELQGYIKDDPFISGLETGTLDSGVEKLVTGRIGAAIQDMDQGLGLIS